MGGTSINTAFTVYSAICFVLVLAPLPWRFATWNTGTVLFRVWVAIAILNAFINSIIWRQDAVNRAPVWCDISSRILVGAHFAIPACTLCIIRRLYLISTTFTLVRSPGEKRKAVIVDIVIGLVYPLVSIVLYYIVQGHRFDIMEEVGCYPVVVATWLSMVFIFCPIVVISCAAAVYAALTAHALHRKRTQLNEFFKPNSPESSSPESNSKSYSSGGMTLGNYMRLMGLAVVQILVVFPLAVYTLVTSITSVRGRFMAYDWVEVHWGFSRVDLIPAVLWRTFATTGIEYPRWLTASCGVIYFAIYGGAKESRTRYAAIFSAVGGWVKGVFGCVGFGGGRVGGRDGTSASAPTSGEGLEGQDTPSRSAPSGDKNDVQSKKKKTKKVKENSIVGEEIVFGDQYARPGRARGRGRRLDLSFLSVSFGNSTVGGGDGSGTGSRWGRSRGAVGGSGGSIDAGLDLEAGDSSSRDGNGAGDGDGVDGTGKEPKVGLMSDTSSKRSRADAQDVDVDLEKGLVTAGRGVGLGVEGEGVGLGNVKGLESSSGETFAGVNSRGGGGRGTR